MKRGGSFGNTPASAAVTTSANSLSSMRPQTLKRKRDDLRPADPYLGPDRDAAQRPASQGVAALIHPPYSWDPTSNQLALDAAKKCPDRFAVMGQFPLDDPESRKRIHGGRNQPGMMGALDAALSRPAEGLARG